MAALGRGVAASVGMAIAGRWLAERFDRPDVSLVDDDVDALAGDGDMMERWKRGAADDRRPL